jgi:hypothetical protein
MDDDMNQRLAENMKETERIIRDCRELIMHTRSYCTTVHSSTMYSNALIEKTMQTIAASIHMLQPIPSLLVIG